jgi:hypothetical protein
MIDGTAVLLQALRAHFFHHALHRRVDAGDADMGPLQTGFEHAVPRSLNL